MTLKKNILNVFLVIMMVLCLTSCKSSKLMIEEININNIEELNKREKTTGGIKVKIKKILYYKFL